MSEAEVAPGYGRLRLSRLARRSAELGCETLRGELLARMRCGLGAAAPEVASPEAVGRQLEQLFVQQGAEASLAFLGKMDPGQLGAVLARIYPKLRLGLVALASGARPGWFELWLRQPPAAADQVLARLIAFAEAQDAGPTPPRVAELAVEEFAQAWDLVCDTGVRELAGCDFASLALQFAEELSGVAATAHARICLGRLGPGSGVWRAATQLWLELGGGEPPGGGAACPQALGIALERVRQRGRELTLADAASALVLLRNLAPLLTLPSGQREVGEVLRRYRDLAPLLPGYWDFVLKRSFATGDPAQYVTLWRVLAAARDEGTERAPNCPALLRAAAMLWLGCRREQTLSRLAVLYQAHHGAEAAHAWTEFSQVAQWSLEADAETEGRGDAKQRPRDLLEAVRALRHLRAPDLLALGRVLGRCRVALPAGFVSGICEAARRDGLWDPLWQRLAGEQQRLRGEPSSADDLRATLGAAVATGQHGVAWRCLAVLRSRDALAPREEQAWRLCPEEHVAWHITPLPAEALDLALLGFDEPLRRGLWALVRLGERLLELAVLSGHLDRPEVTALGERLRGGPWRELAPVLAAQTVLCPDKPAPLQRLGLPACAFPRPPWMECLPPEPYPYLVAGTGYRLSLPFWGGTLERLRELVSEPRRCADWVDSLSALQRGSWLDWVDVLTTVPGERLAAAAWDLSCRLALAMLGNHLAALTGLAAARARPEVVQRLEAYMLSQDYHAKAPLPTPLPVPLA